MENNTAKTFIYDETFKLVKKELDVKFLDPQVMLSVSERAIVSINYWEGRASKGTKEQKQLYAIEIARLEALMQRMTEMSLDVYRVDASAYLDARGFVEDKSVENVLTDVAAKADVKVDAESSKEEAPIVSIFDGETELKTPKLTDLSAAIKGLLKKGRFDSANLMAAKFLTVGDYIPKKEKQQPVKWSEAKIASWIRDINDSLMSEKVDTKKEIEKQETAKEEKKEPDNAAQGAWDKVNELNADEIEGLRLLEFIIPDAIAGQQDPASRREKLKVYLTLGKDLNAEDAMLWAFAKRIFGANADTKISQGDLAKLYVDIDKFSKIFFAHRLYTENSVQAWRNAAKKEANISNFKYLKVKEDIDPLNLKKSGINMEAISKRVEEECLAGKTVQEVLEGLEEGILYKEIEGKDKTSTSIYTKLHAKDLIERIYSVYSTKATVKPAEGKVKVATPTKIISADKSKIDIAEVKLLLSTIAQNGGTFDDVKSHPEILNLIDREIQNNSKSPALKFGNETVLFPYLEVHFNDIVSKLPKVEITDTVKFAEDAPTEEAKVESKTADLNNTYTLCDFAARNDVSQEDFIKQNQSIVMTKDGKFKSLMSATTQGGSKTISISNANDFAVWVASVYKTVAEKKAPVEDPELVKSMKDLNSKGKELLEKGTTYEIFMDWLKKNLLNRKLLEQKPDKLYKSMEAIKAFAHNTWGKKLPKPVDVVAETLKTIEANKEKVDVSEEVDKLPEVMSMDEINAHIAEMSVKENVTLYSLIPMLRDLYLKNNIQVQKEACTLKTAYPIVEAIIKESNPTMYADRQQRKAEMAALREKQPNLPLEDETNEETKIGPVEAKTEPVVGDVTDDTNTVDAEHSVFAPIDVAAKHPELWKAIEKFTTIEEVYNQAMEFNEADDFNSALSLCLVILPKIEASKEWTSEYITDWFNKMILKQGIESDEVDKAEEASVEEKPVVELGEEFNELKEATNPKSFARCIAEILKSKEDNKELRNQIIAAINAGKGSHTRKVARMPDTEKHKQINNIKRKVDQHEPAEQA